MTYRILLFYKYVTLENADDFAKKHFEYCKELGIKGRIIIANEGINGTISGTVQQTEKYMDDIKKIPQFKDMDFKIDSYHKHAFPRLSVKFRKEIVTWKLSNKINPSKVTGIKLKPQEFYNFLLDKDVLILDGRNKYEYDIGHFRNAICANVQTTREFPEWIAKNLTMYKDKKIVTYCTGGIRCEKLTSYLIQKGFKKVYQLDGGIIKYGKDPVLKGKLFDGKCYVFDSRIAIPINQVENIVVGRCYHCKKPEDNYLNCRYDFCHKQHIVCKDCKIKYQSYCSLECKIKDEKNTKNKNKEQVII